MMKKPQTVNGRRIIPAAMVFSFISCIAGTGFYLVSFFAINGTINGSPVVVAQKSAQLPGKNKSAENIRQNQTPASVPGEYLVTLDNKGNAHDVRRIFSGFSIMSITALDNTPGVFLLKLKDDPGLEILQKTAKKSGQVKHVQPNFIYRLNPQRHGGPQ